MPGSVWVRDEGASIVPLNTVVAAYGKQLSRLFAASAFHESVDSATLSLFRALRCFARKICYVGNLKRSVFDSDCRTETKWAGLTNRRGIETSNVWCVLANGGIRCATGGGEEPNEAATSFATRCGQNITLPHGISWQAPTRADCRSAIETSYVAFCERRRVDMNRLC